VAAGLLASPLPADGQGGMGQAVSMLALAALALAGGAFQPVLAVLFPRWTTATRAAVEQRRGLCLLWGFVILLWIFVLVVLTNVIAKWLGAIALVFLLLAGLMSVAGYVGVAAAFGSCLIPADVTREDRTPLQALVGGLILCVSCLVPILGQVLALWLCLGSIGAAAVALLRRSGPEAPSAAPPEASAD